MTRNSLISALLIVGALVSASACRRKSAEATATADRLKWEFAIANDPITTVAIGLEGTLYVGASDGYLYAITPEGKKQWAFYAGGIASAPSVGPDGTIYFTNIQGTAHALDPQGTVKWTAETTGRTVTHFHGGGAIDRDTYYVQCRGGVCALSIGDGSLRFRAGRSLTQYSAPVIFPYSFVAFPGNGRMFAVSLNGDKRWMYPEPELQDNDGDGEDDDLYIGPGGVLFRNAPAMAADGTTYTGTGDGKLIAVNEMGEKRWEFQILTAGHHLTPAVVDAAGNVYFGAEDQNFYALDSSGNLLWKLQTGGSIQSAPVLASDGTMYVAAGWNLLAVTPEGRIAWQYKLAQGTGVPLALGEDGTVYVAGNRGTLYAIRGEAGGLMKSSWPKYQADAQNSGRAMLE